MTTHTQHIKHAATQLKFTILKQHLKHHSDDETMRHIIEMAFKKYFPNGIKQ